MGLWSEDNDFRNYVIQRSKDYYFIDEGPYMSSLEHLVQHYMTFSDGLPTKLRYPVAPKPKPPLPPTSIQDPTLKAKSSLHKLLKFSSATPAGQPLSVEGSSAALINRERKLSKDADQLQKLSLQMKERNLSLPSDDLMNQVGLSSPPTISMATLSPPVDATSPIGTKPKKSPKKTFSPNFLSLKLPKKSSKSKIKSTNDSNDNASNFVTNDQISKTFSTLSFTSDIINQDDSLYKQPNSIPVSRIDDNQNSLSSTATLPLSIRLNSNRKDSHSDVDYMEKFTQSDKQNATVDETHDKDNSIEEIYFVEAPTKVVSIDYIAFKQVPYFPSSTATADTSNNNAINNNSLVNSNAITNTSTRADRVLSVESTLSNDLDLMLALQNGNTGNYSEKGSPNYYIPGSSIELDNVLGQGEFGSVYKGHMRCETQNGEFKTPVAIKTLLDEHCKENRIEFLREASVMIKLQHHCIVKMIGISKVRWILNI